ncbi:putative HXXXD-type acyl-transferase family protein [Hibiscus syriacus]|uniref:HXXXD-type acyl-transferase family protein n=1 Tax=Hibiscus syriacus TaxID=106335 RepID=A0A6A3BXB5_HIBSY|nr:putative HXXXD-type acyl-transferase family protein [Hibiscus syriacus]
MASSSTVKTLENTQIKPSSESPNSASQSPLSLTFFDTNWFKISPVERLFFYNLNGSTRAYFSSQIVPKFKQSLSVAPHHYLPITGNRKWPSNAPKPFIYYALNNGVSLIVAESDADFDRLTGDGIIEALELHPLMSQMITSDDSASILSIQITLFPDKGFSIGITAHHIFLDGKTRTMFMKTWTYLCRQGTEQNSELPPELIPSFAGKLSKILEGLTLISYA